MPEKNTAGRGPSFEITATGLLYRNPKPHLHSIHAYFPSVVALDKGEMLATLVLGEAFEAANCRTCLARSQDDGATWRLEGRLCDDDPHPLASNAARLTALGGDELVAFMVRHDRAEYSEEGLANPATLGFVPTELLLLRSHDRGHTWSTPEALQPPLTGSPFELCAPITVLSDGRWLLPTSTWPAWDGACPHGLRMIALVSADAGRSWSSYLDVMHDAADEKFYWESKIVELPDHRLLGVAWTYDRNAGRDLPIQYALSDDGGATWAAPASTGLQGQTLSPLLLEDGRLLSVYRRTDRPGLWANLSHLDGNEWFNDTAFPLWGHRAHGLTEDTEDMVHNFNVLRFGAPSLARLPDGAIFVAFWCYEDCVSNIRWLKLRL
jgi:hypothetical protein